MIKKILFPLLTAVSLAFTPIAHGSNPSYANTTLSLDPGTAPEHNAFSPTLTLADNGPIQLAQVNQNLPANPAPTADQTLAPQPGDMFPIPVSLDFFTNILNVVPRVTNFANAKFSLNTGAMIRNGGLENLIKFDGYFHTNWMVSAEIQNAPSSTVVDALRIAAGYRWTWVNAQVYGQIGGQRNWSTALGIHPSFQGDLTFGAAWVPMTGGRFNLFGELRALTSATGGPFSRLELVPVAGANVSF